MGALKKSNLNRLRKRGYSGYRAYLRSAHWERVKRAYRLSLRPTSCVACGGTPVELHHRTYTRLGAERLNDLMPLCRGCHGLVHRRIEDNPGWQVQGTPAILRTLFGWSKAETRRRMAPFDAPDGLRPIL
jgi:5-methylcytosine-specific restriction endonuclease McrA